MIIFGILDSNTDCVLTDYTSCTERCLFGLEFTATPFIAERNTTDGWPTVRDHSSNSAAIYASMLS